MSVRGVRVASLAAIAATLLGGAGLAAPAAFAGPGGGPSGPPPVEGPASLSGVLAGSAPAPAVSGLVIAAGCVSTTSAAGFYAPAAPEGGKSVALTFDDGPGPATTAQVIAVLRKYGVPATFFNIGENAARYPSLVQEEATLGFLVGNHTWSHPELTTLSASGQASQLDEASAEQEATIGWGPCVFRPPYGSYNSTTLSLARQRHIATWIWSVDTEDWKANGSSSSYWVSRIISLAESEGGALAHPVVLMHNMPSGNPATVAALPTVISYFRSRGYTFVNLAGSTGTGYRAAAGGGGVASFDATGYGSAAGRLPKGVTVAGLATDPGTGGYWELASSGAVYAYHAPGYGSAAGKLPRGVTATAIAADHGGYLVLASDGGVHPYGAPFHGSVRGKLPKGVRAVGLAADVATGGYWILESDGAIVAFDAPSRGSLDHKLQGTETAAGIAATPQGGYLVLTSAGRVVAFHGQGYGQVAGKMPAGVTAVALAMAPASGGYWVLESNGTIAAFHAPARGSLKIPAGHRAASIAGD